MAVPSLHEFFTFKLFFIMLCFLKVDLGYSMGKKYNATT